MKNERLAVTGNAAVLAILHTIYGGFISYLFYHLFDEFDEKWKKRSQLYKFTDVSVEIMLIAAFGYWASELTDIIPPIFPTTEKHREAVDTWVSGIFFVIALFLFLDELTDKLKYLHHYYFENVFSAYLPQYGSLIDMNLSYTPVEGDDTKKKYPKTEKV
jgi:hypothetical protein